MKTWKYLFLSDLHLGGACNYKALRKFLRENNAQTWYLVGDIVDVWAVQRSRTWPAEAMLVLQDFLAKAKKGQKIIICPGNHDNILRSFELFDFGNIQIAETAMVEIAGKRYLVMHGDVFDAVIVHAVWLARIGGAAYDFLVRLNSRINWARGKCGFPYWSLSARIKKMVKHAVSYISDFEVAVTTFARKQGAQGVVCGHIHTPDAKIVNGVEYFNCGDFVESMTALGVQDWQHAPVELIHC